MREGKEASSFAIFGLRVGFARIANVLGLVRWLGTNIAFRIAYGKSYLVVKKIGNR